MEGRTISSKRSYATHEHIIVKGDTGNEAYVILEGSVEVYKRINGKKITFTTLHQGDVFGEMACITDEVRTASVVALEPTVCSVITANNLSEQLNKTSPWFTKIVNALVKRLKNMDQIAHPLLISDCTWEVLNQLKLQMLCYGLIDEDEIISYSLPDVICEISDSLRIPEKRIRPIIAGIVDIGIMELTDKLILKAPNWNLFSDFVEFCKNAPKLAASSTRTIARVDVHKIYTDGTSLVHRHAHLPPSQAMEPMKTLRVLIDKLPKEDADAQRKNFAEILKQLTNYAQQSEFTNANKFGSRKTKRINPKNPPKISWDFNKASNE